MRDKEGIERESLRRGEKKKRKGGRKRQRRTKEIEKESNDRNSRRIVVKQRVKENRYDLRRKNEEKTPTGAYSVEKKEWAYNIETYKQRIEGR